MHWEDELTYLAGLIADTGCSDLELGTLRTLPLGDAYFCMARGLLRPACRHGPVSRMAKRTVPHVRTYTSICVRRSLRLSDSTSSPSDPPRQRPTLHLQLPPVYGKFLESLGGCSIETMRFHLERKDFERWLREVLHDDELAPTVAEDPSSRPGRRLPSRSAPGDRRRPVRGTGESNLIAAEFSQYRAIWRVRYRRCYEVFTRRYSRFDGSIGADSVAFHQCRSDCQRLAL